MARVWNKAAVVAGLALAIAAGGHLAAQEKPVSASDGRIKLPASGETTTSGYVVVDNPTMYDIYLISAVSDAAGKVEFRDLSKADAAAQVVPEVTVPAYGRIAMAPKGLQLVLTGLKRPLKEGDTVALTLTTDGGVKLEIPAVVKKD
jgi:copper(I)-binding protein